MISKDQVDNIAKLARVSLSKKEIKRFQKEFSSILDYFNSLKELNVNNVKPTFHPTEHFFEQNLDIARKDESYSSEEGLAIKIIEAAPDRKDNYIKVREIFN